MGGIERAVGLLRRTTALSDLQLRVDFVRSSLVAVGADELSDLVQVVRTGAEAREPGLAELFLLLAIAFSDRQCADLRRAVVAAATLRGQLGAAQVLRYAEDGLASNRSLPQTGQGRTPTLGERKSTARRSDRNLVQRALRDPHHSVIRILLGNPSMTEADVVQLCARRPVAYAVVREVFRAPRWIVRYHVKRALVLNPHAPGDVTLPLLPFLTEPDLRLVREMGELPPVVRDASTRISQVHEPH